MKDQQPINVMHIAFEPSRPRETMSFDPRLDLTDQDRRNLTAEFQRSLTAKDWPGLAYAGIALKYFFLDKQPNFDLEGILRQMAQDRFPRKFQRQITGWDTDAFIAMRDAVFYKLFLGEKSAILLNQRGVKENLQQAVDASTHPWDNYFPDSMHLAIAYPRHQQERRPNEWQILGNFLGLLRQNSDFFDFAETAMAGKILFPQEFKQIEITAGDWRQMKTTLDILRQNLRSKISCNNFIYMALAMTIISAKEVKVTDEGLDITLPKLDPSFSTPTPDIPTVRKF